MRQFLILTIFIYLSYESAGQKFSLADCRIVETEAIFENGPGDWLGYLQKTLKNDIAAMNGCQPGKYTVKIKFVVSQKGEVTQIKASTNYGYGMENEAIRIISASPKWIPSTRNGRATSSYRFQLITFEVCDREVVI